MSRARSATLALAAALAAGQARAADEAPTVLSSYSATQLDRLWGADVAAQAPKAVWYEALRSYVQTPSYDAGPSGTARPPIGGRPTVGEAVTGGGTQAPKTGFPVVPLPTKLGGTLTKRAAWLELYLSRAAAFTGVGDRIKVDKRVRSATAELYLLTLLRYFEADTLARKCARIRRADELAQAWRDGAVEAGWEELKPLVRDLLAFQRDPERLLVCQLHETTTREQTVTEVHKKVDGMIKPLVDDQVVKLGAAFSGAQTSLDQGVKDLDDEDYALNTKGVLELKASVAAARATIDMVNNDSLGMKTKEPYLVKQLQEKDFSSLKSGKKQTDVVDAQKARTTAGDALTPAFAALARLAATPKDGPTKQKLAPCAALDHAWTEVHFDSATDHLNFTTRLDNCLDGALDVARSLQDRPAEERLGAAFGAALSKVADEAFRAGGN